MKRDEIEVGNKYMLNMFNDEVEVISKNNNGTVTINWKGSKMDTYPRDLSMIKVRRIG